MLRKLIGLICLAWAGMIVFNFWNSPVVEGNSAYEQGLRIGAIAAPIVFGLVGLRLLFSESSAASEPRYRKKKKRRKAGQFDSRDSAVLIAGAALLAVVVGMILYVLHRPSAPHIVQPAEDVATTLPAMQDASPAAAGSNPHTDAGAAAANPAPAPAPAGRTPDRGALVNRPPSTTGPKLKDREKNSEAMPSGFLALTPDVELVAGAPVKVRQQPSWSDATILRVMEGGRLNVLIEDSAHQTRFVDRVEVAVSPKTLETLKRADAAARFASEAQRAERTVAGKPELPPNGVPVAAQTKLVPGTPVMVYRARWIEGTVLSVTADGRIEIREQESSFTKIVDRDALAILSETLESLNAPDAKTKYAEAAKEARRAMRHRIVQRYRAEIARPKTAVQVTAETPLRPGAIVSICFGRKWEEVGVIAVNDDDSVHIRWNRRRVGTEEDVEREDLIIAKSVLRKLKELPKSSSAKGPSINTKPFPSPATPPSGL